MAVSLSYTVLSHNGTGSQTEFPVTWPFYSGSLVVTLVASTGVETVQTITTHYTVTGGTDANGTAQIGTVTMLTAPASGETLRITRGTPQTQTLTLTNGGDFSPVAVMNAFDKLTLLVQERGSGAGSDDLDGLTGDVMQLDASGVTDFWDAEDHIIRNVADGVEDDDAATVGQIEALAEAATLAYITPLLANPDADLASGSVLLDDISAGFDGVETTFDLEVLGVARTPAAAAQLVVHVGNSYQTPGTGYTVSGSEITFTSAPAAGLTCAMVLVQIDTSGLDDSVTAAAASATAAAGSATTAATQATAAAGSATAAAASYDSFDDRYLGAKSSDPSTDNDGGSLITGALYFNSSSNVMKVYDGAAWVVAYVPSGSSVSSFNSRTGAVTPASGDYETSDITGISAFGQTLVDDADAATARGTLGVQTYLCDDISAGFNGADTVFALTASASPITPRSAANVVCAVGGALQIPGTGFTVTGTNITFTSAPAAGVTASIQVINA